VAGLELAHCGVCGRFPECSFEVMDSTIQEAKRRHLQRVTRGKPKLGSALLRRQQRIPLLSSKPMTGKARGLTKSVSFARVVVRKRGKRDGGEALPQLKVRVGRTLRVRGR